MERKLASIQEVVDIKEITTKTGEPANNIEEVHILGWRLVAKKGQFHVGDLCVYFEVDSVLNPKLDWVQEHASFLSKNNWRIKTMSLKSMRVADSEGDLIPVVSQGLALPLTILDSRNFTDEEITKQLSTDFKINIDLTDILGIKKYERAIKFFEGETANEFPPYIPKTDEIRVQTYPELVNELKGKPYYISLKVDGTSFTAWWDSTVGLRVASRNFERKNDGNIYWQAALKYNLENVLKDKPHLAIQGEIAGKGIQDNLLELEDMQMFVFNIFNIETGKYFDVFEMTNFCIENKLQMVDILSIGTSFDFTLPELEEYSKGNYDFTNNPREGIVVRSQNNAYSKWLLNRLSFKVINVDYLLAKDE